MLPGKSLPLSLSLLHSCSLRGMKQKLSLQSARPFSLQVTFSASLYKSHEVWNDSTFKQGESGANSLSKSLSWAPNTCMIYTAKSLWLETSRPPYLTYEKTSRNLEVAQGGPFLATAWAPKHLVPLVLAKQKPYRDHNTVQLLLRVTKAYGRVKGSKKPERITE